MADHRLVGDGRSTALLRPDAQTVRARVLAAITEEGGLPQSYGGDPQEADASALMIPIFHLLPPRDRRNRRLVEATLRSLSDGNWP